VDNVPPTRRIRDVPVVLANLIPQPLRVAIRCPMRALCERLHVFSSYELFHLQADGRILVWQAAMVCSSDAGMGDLPDRIFDPRGGHGLGARSLRRE